MMDCFIFPGQGSQYIGMGKDFFESSAEAKDVFLEADDLLERNFSKLIFDGNSEELNKTINSQLAIFIFSSAIVRTLEKQFPTLFPYATSGLSLGEYSALWASKKISFKDALLLIAKRAKFMEEACERADGTMAAVLGLEKEKVDEVIRALNPPHKVWVANYNCPGQQVISGLAEGVAKASESLKTYGAKRVIPLKVQGAFHTPLMESAKKLLKEEIYKVNFIHSPVLMVMNFTGEVAEGELLRHNLVEQVCGSVKWEQGIRGLFTSGVKRFIEIGPGKTLTGMNKKIGMDAISISIEKIQDLEQLECY